MRRAPVILLAFLPLAAHAVVDTTSTVDPGTADTSYAWVGRMNGATAVAVGRRTVLTAAHVSGGNFTLGDAIYQMASTTVSPKISGKKVDLRVVQVDRDLPGWYSLGTSVRSSMTVTMVGFGGGGVVNSRGNGYNLWGGGVRRAGDNLITAKKSFSGRGPSITAMLNSAGESVLAGGDSGGGWFVNGKLVGISAFVFSNNSRKSNYGWASKAYFGSGAIDLTNTKVAGWVRSQTISPRELGASPEAVPEPASLAILGIGAIALVRWRKR